MLLQPQNAGGKAPPCCFTCCAFGSALSQEPSLHLQHSLWAACLLPAAFPCPQEKYLPWQGCHLPKAPSRDAGKDYIKEMKEEEGSRSPARLLCKLLVSHFIEEREQANLSPPFACAPQLLSICFVLSLNPADL